MTTPPVTVALVTLGCARNDVDSEELAGRLEAGGFRLVDDAAEADTVVVNTCGFVEAAKKDSVDTLLAAADYKDSGRTQAVVAVGCLAERYGDQLAEALPETDAVLSFDDYADISDRLRSILSGDKHHPHTPRDRRKLLPLSPAARQSAAPVATPGHGTTPAPAATPRHGGNDTQAHGDDATSAASGGTPGSGNHGVTLGDHIPSALKPLGDSAASGAATAQPLKGRMVSPSGTRNELKIDA